MTLPAPLHTCLVASFSSAITILVLLLLIRPGYDNMITTVVDRVQASPSAGVASQCPQSKESSALRPWQELSPTKFVKDPWMHPIYNQNGISNETAYWDSLLPPNGGFLMVDLGHDKNQSMGVSMFHQLHCLSLVRSMVVGGGMHNHPNHGGKTNSPADDHNMHKHPNRGGQNNSLVDDHIMHCFDYIAQAILCSADDALEESLDVLDTKGMEKDVVNGMGQTHQCRNATMLYDYVLQSVQVPIKPALLGKNMYSVFP